MVAVEGAKDANGNIVSPIVLKTPGGTAYTKFCIVKTQDGSCRKLFGQIDPLEDATASAPKTKRKSTGKAKEVSPNTTPYTEIKKKLKLVPSSDIVVAQKSVDKSVIKRCSNRKRVSTVTLLGASAAEIRAAFTAEHTGKPNRKSADWSHMIPHSQGGENEKGGVTSPRHNTARLLTVEHLTRHLAVEKDLKLDVECAAEFMRDSSGDLTLLMSKENNTVVARDVKAGKSSTFSIDFPDAQLDGAVPKSLLHLSKNLVMFGNYQTLVPKSDRGAKRKASDASPAATTSTPPAQPVKRPRHST